MGAVAEKVPNKNSEHSPGKLNSHKMVPFNDHLAIIKGEKCWLYEIFSNQWVSLNLEVDITEQT